MGKLHKIGTATVLSGVIFALATGCVSPVTPIPDEDPDDDPQGEEPTGYVATGSSPAALGDLYVIPDTEIALG